MKKLLFTIIFLTTLNTFAQTYGNGWINYSQEYYKFTTAEDGMYKVTFTELVALGYPTANNNLSHLQLFHEGHEMAIELVDNDNNNSFNSGDYFIFYGQRNDGKNDAELYRPTTAQPHQYYSLYTDENAYFLTYSPSEVGKRMENVAYQSGNQVIEFHDNEDLLLNTSEYSLNDYYGPIKRSRDSYYSAASSFTGENIIGENFSKTLTFTNRNLNSTNIKLTFNVIGRAEYYSNGFGSYKRTINYTVGQQTGNFSLDYFENKEQTVFLNENDIVNEQISLDFNSAIDRYSFNFYKLEYSQKIPNNGTIFFNSSTIGKNFKIDSPLQNFSCYDVTDLTSLKKLGSQNESNYSLITFPLNITTTKVYIANQLNDPLTSKKITFTIPNINTNYLIITHSSLMDASTNYKTFRESTNGGSFNCDLVEIEELYDQFNYGEKSPLAIRRYSNYMLSNGVNKKYLLLIGKAISIYFNRTRATINAKDLVPTFGYPGSDLLLTAGLNGSNEYVNAIPTGRIPALTNIEVQNYLDKVIQRETEPLSFTNKSIIQSVGGRSVYENNRFLDTFNELEDLLNSSNINPRIFKKYKKTYETTPIPGGFESYINGGVSFFSFLGHGNYKGIEMAFESITESNSKINNSKYPVVMVSSCNYNNDFNIQTTETSKWLFAKDKGSIASIGQSNYGYESILSPYLKTFYDILLNDNNEEPTLGIILQKSADEMRKISNFSTNHILNNYQTNLYGDPALKIFNIDTPDYSLTNSEIILKSTNDNPISDNGNAYLEFSVKNYGRSFTDNINLRITGYNDENSIFIINNTVTLPENENDFKILIPITNTLNKIEVEIDPSNQIQEKSETNNKSEILLDQNLLGLNINSLNSLTKTINYCSGNNINLYFDNNNSQTIQNYQWQINNGNGIYENLNNNSVYSGVNSSSLLMSNLEDTYNNKTYRCLVTINNNQYFTNTSTLNLVNLTNQNLELIGNSTSLDHYSTTSSITSTQKVIGNSIYEANNSICLLPGFETQDNTVFIAEIQSSCYFYE